MVRARGLGGGDGEVELHYHQLLVIQSDMITIYPGEQVVESVQ